ncbi:MAG: type II toxin-antitoxin system VapC family toxin [Gemmatimonadales bacterium]
MKFWDSSALVPLLSNQPYTDAMREIAAGDPTIGVWWGTPVECASALARLWRQRVIGAEAHEQAHRRLRRLAGEWYTVEATRELRELALRQLRTHPLRAGDALQLAAALVWAEESPTGREMVSLDERLRDAALREGFEVLPGGAQ